MPSKALSKAPTLRLASAAPAAAVWASGRLAGALGARSYASGKAAGREDSYDQMKEAARRSGDPAREWMQGAKGKASAYAENAEQVYEAAKRGTQDVTARARESAREGVSELRATPDAAALLIKQKAARAAGGDLESMRSGVSQAAAQAGGKISDAASRAAQAVQETVGGDVSGKVSQAASSAAEAVKDAFVPEDLSGPGKGLPSARAKFEAGRSQEVKARENADRKSQLTDEVTTGDNPAEQRTRDEHEILDSDFYTRH